MTPAPYPTHGQRAVLARALPGSPPDGPAGAAYDISAETVRTSRKVAPDLEALVRAGAISNNLAEMATLTRAEAPELEARVLARDDCLACATWGTIWTVRVYAAHKRRRGEAEARRMLDDGRLARLTLETLVEGSCRGVGGTRLLRERLL